MSQLKGRAALNAVLACASLILVPAVLSRPDTAAADRVHAAANSALSHGKSKAPSRHVHPAARARHIEKRPLSPGMTAVRIANHLTGIPYVWGGASPRSGFDCSGLVQYVYGRLGISLPHYTVSQYQRGHFVARSHLRAGDLVFFYGLDHVGIYAGGGKYIHAPTTGSSVRWASLTSTPSYYGARRILP
jgi:cell wall-associated NlpC family hydrolase